MFMIRRSLNTGCTPGLAVSANRQILYALMVGAVMIGLSGCGQKGNLYLTDTSSETIAIGTEASDDPNDY